MTTCSDCGSENREGARFCNACGALIQAETAEVQAPVDPSPLEAPEDQGLGLSLNTDEPALDSTPGENAEVPDAPSEIESGSDWVEDDGEGSADSTDTEEALSPEPPKAGYLVFPDDTEQPIPPSQWLIGRADLAKYLGDPEKANEISRGHLTVFQEGERFFVEDGTTMVQRKASANKTWLVRGSTRILVTGAGRNELQDEDEIDVAELVKLQFVVK